MKLILSVVVVVNLNDKSHLKLRSMINIETSFFEICAIYYIFRKHEGELQIG